MCRWFKKAPSKTPLNVRKSYAMGSNLASHDVYARIVRALTARGLAEPFTRDDFRKACPGACVGTYNTFLDKHRTGNPGGNFELFEKVTPGSFRLLRPLGDRPASSWSTHMRT